MLEQKLDIYEADLDFKSVLMSIEDAIQKNKAVMCKEGSNTWMKTEWCIKEVS